MNIDRSAFDLRRELGITLGEPAIVARLQQVFDSDWALSHHYEPPGSAGPVEDTRGRFPRTIPELVHE